MSQGVFHAAFTQFKEHSRVTIVNFYRGDGTLDPLCCCVPTSVDDDATHVELELEMTQLKSLIASNQIFIIAQKPLAPFSLMRWTPCSIFKAEKDYRPHWHIAQTKLIIIENRCGFETILSCHKDFVTDRIFQQGIVLFNAIYLKKTNYWFWCSKFMPNPSA